MLKIAIIGPESTGKTELTQALATHFDTVWEPELAREYVEQLNREYTFDDVCEIAKRQIENEKKYELNKQQDQIVFFDTDLIITKVWLAYKYKRIPEFVTNRLNDRFIDCYLLCEPDLAWEPDHVREHGNDRDFFFDWYKREIENLQIPYHTINGAGELRLQNALNALSASGFIGKR
ncbi:MAG: ATP-binding protein [Paludibacteraceae bacterium]